MRQLRPTIVAAAIIAAAVPMSSPAAPPPECSGTVTEAGGFYVDVRDPAELSIWIYQESNGIAGLQRGGVSDISDDSSCAEFDSAGNQTPPDTLISSDRQQKSGPRVARSSYWAVFALWGWPPRSPNRRADIPESLCG
jgi:hypothetical protein